MKDEGLIFPLKEEFVLLAAIALCPFVLIKDILFPPSQEEIEKMRKDEIERMKQHHYKHDRKLDGALYGRP